MSTVSPIFQTGSDDLFSVMTYSTFAVVLGIVCNNIANFIDRSNLPLVSTNVYASAILKIAVIGFILLFVKNNISPHFGSDWQNTTPGFFFVIIFFNMQYNLLATLQFIAKQWNA